MKAQPPDRCEHRAGTHIENFGDRAALDITQHLGDLDAILAGAVTQIGREPQNRIARDAMQDTAGQSRRTDMLALIDEGYIHRARLFHVAALVCV